MKTACKDWDHSDNWFQSFVKLATMGKQEKNTDKELIENGLKLNDKHINFAHGLLMSQFKNNWI